MTSCSFDKHQSHMLSSWQRLDQESDIANQLARSSRRQMQAKLWLGPVCWHRKVLCKFYNHLQNSDKCRNLCTEKNFIILDTVSTVVQLKIKVALHIQWQQPSLNKQVFHVNLGLFINVTSYNISILFYLHKLIEFKILLSYIVQLL